jgi:2-polyprenyl-6-methoxyphenol hydroxylase-like FAD-dependent oxidoreductase
MFEARSENSDILSSGVILTPNRCQVFDELGSLNRTEEKSYICEYTATKDADDKTVRKMRITSDTCHCYRLYRLAVHREMKTALAESKVPIFYSMELEKIISDTADDVVFQVGDRTQSAAMVIGSDGIHSTLRRHITDLVPVYTNFLCVYGHIPTNTVKWLDQDFAAGCTIFGKPGSLFVAPEVADGSDLMVWTQFAHPEADQTGWETLASTPASLAALLRKHYDQWHDTAKHAIDELCKHSERILCWPFYTMPKLPSWSSSSVNVIMMGDAAHAMPASSVQGVNHAVAV